MQPPAPDDATAPSSAIDGGRFVPGTILDARYRIVSLLGRGAMGEVYRAEDMKLGETVALKFLPEGLGADGEALARFHREVRIARGIAHSNVVRVYDIGEQDGQAFLSMEYVDGEDLSALIRRIGHVPEKKGVELARQICAGLAAAHRAGVLHRDLKPANVMIDSAGHAKINDFGLAFLVSDGEAPNRAGTPLYMAPEQLSGGQATYASDVYSLGLVLYEMFTGERPFQTETWKELIEAQREGKPAPIGTHVEGVDPLIERAILRCLAFDASSRPQSPLDVAAQLPGSDPLAAALAAGETPSPEMVARARVPGVLRPPLAWLLLATTLIAITALLFIQARVSVLRFDGLPLEPAVLDHQAKRVLEQIGWEGDLRGIGSFTLDEYFATKLSESERSEDEWKRLAARRPTFMEYWYRVGTGGIAPTQRWNSVVRIDDPAPTTPGTATIRLDSRGRLREILAVPRDRALATETSPATPDWTPFFAAAGLELAELSASEPWRAPLVYADHIEVWRGSYPGQPASTIRVEAASRGGQVVFWRLTDEEVLSGGEAPAGPPVWLALCILATMWLVGGWQAYRNLRSGRGDRSGAARVACVAGIMVFVSDLLRVSRMTTSVSLSLLFAQLAAAVLVAMIVWVVYLALEPVLRRHHPRGIVSWSRLLAGRLRDPLIGRDVLVGLASTAVFATVLKTVALLRFSSSGGELADQYPHGLCALLGPTIVLGNVLSIVQILLPLALLFLWVSPRIFLPWPRVATIVGSLALAGFCLLWQGSLVSGLAWAAFVLLLVSYVGLLGLVAMSCLMSNLVLTPVTLDRGAWWAANSWIGVAVVVTITVLAYRLAVDRRSVA